MFKMFNKSVSILAVLFFAFAMTSCSGLFESQETGSVSFSLSNEQLRSIISEKQSARSLTQGNDDGSDETMTVQIGIYSDDYEYLAGTKASATFANIEKGSGIELTIDDVPIGKSRLLALIYDSACNCENTYCGAEMITVTTGTNNVPVEMIKFKGAFSQENKDKTFATYVESAVCSGDDDQLGHILLLVSEDKPFYAIIYGGNVETDEGYKVASIGICDIKEWYPDYTVPRRVRFTELAGIGNDSFEKFDFLDTPKKIDIVAKEEDVPESELEEYYKVTYDIPYYGKTLSLYTYSIIYLHNTLTINAQDCDKFPEGAEYVLTFTEIAGEKCEYVAASGVLNEYTRKIIILSSTIEKNIEEAVGTEYYQEVIAIGETLFGGCLPVKYKLLVTYLDNEEKTVKLISTDEKGFNFNLHTDSEAFTSFKEKEGVINFSFVLPSGGEQENNLPEYATELVLLMANNGDFVGSQDSGKICYTLYDFNFSKDDNLIDDPYSKLSIPLGRFNGFKDIISGELHFRISFKVDENTVYEGDTYTKDGIDVSEDYNFVFNLY